MIKKIFFLSSIVFVTSLLFSNGFNIVIDNDLNQENYIIEHFKQDFINGDYLLCVDNYGEWGNNVKFKDRWKLNIDTKSQIQIIHEKSGIQVSITKSNFEKFKNSFISNKCFKFQNQFPVKFFKVKTAHNLNQKFTLKDTPEGDIIIEKNSDVHLFYYCYKKASINEKEYVLLGTNSKIDPQLDNDVKNKILGWILYKENKNPVNTVLWNTNIGIRPDENNYESLKVYKNSGNFSSENPNDKNLLVSEEGISRYVDRYTSKNGQINRWLPLYKSNFNKQNYLPIGVIEKSGEIRRDLENLVTAKEINIVYLIDNTASMRPVWENLYKTVNSSINSLLTDFTNIAGDSVKPKIKVLYYSDNITVLNEQWIRTIEDLKKYKDKIASIKPINSKYYRPEIQNAFNYILKKMNKNPLYVVVIGDAGDHRYKGAFFDLYQKQAKTNLIIPKGIRYNSALKDDEFQIAYNDFQSNFELLYDIPGNSINEHQALTIGEHIGSAIKEEYKYIINKYPDILSGSYEFDLTNSDSYSIFTKNYLKSVTVDLNTLGAGSFYEEGLLFSGAEKNYGKDIIIDESKIRILKEACSQFRHDNSSENLKFAIRQICAGFFEIDFYQVSDNFLLNTNLSDFWSKVVGSKEIADILVPGLFALDKSFAEIVDNADRYINLFNMNAELINENILKHLNPPFQGKYFEVKNPETNTIERFYWVEVETINLFEGIE